MTVKYSIAGACGRISQVTFTDVGSTTVTKGLRGTSVTLALSPVSGSITPPPGPAGVSSALRSSSVHFLTCAALSWME